MKIGALFLFRYIVLLIFSEAESSFLFMASIRFKKDKYRRARGGYSRLLQISCEKCGNVVALYQKDGPGPLKRMYLDRIMEPSNITDKNFVCGKCEHLLGVRYIYEKEKRPAFRLFEGAITKKIVKAS